MMYWDGGGWGAGMLVMGVFWIALMALVIWAVLGFARSPHPSAGGDLDSARRVLDRRYAAGEITTEQYAEMRRILEGRGVELAKH